MDESTIIDKINYLKEFLLPERYDALCRVLQQRTRYMTLCLEDVFYSQNASAVVRTCDAFGIQDMHVIEDRVHFKTSRDIVRGSQQWVDIHRYRAPECGTQYLIDRLRSRGYRIVATSPHGSLDATPQSFDVSKGKFALFFGTEKQGISQTLAGQADEFIKIPMYGFVESLNLSVCAAITSQTLIEQVRTNKNIAWQLQQEESDELLFQWIYKSVKDADKIMKLFPRGKCVANNQ